MPITGRSKIKESPQEIQNQGFDEEHGTPVVQIVGEDGSGLQRNPAKTLAMKITEVGTVSYIGVAAPGTAQATAKWQCRKLDETSGLVTTWADGDTNFDNVATDLTSLSYS